MPCSTRNCAPEIDIGIREIGVTLLGIEGSVLEVGGGHGVAIVVLLVTGVTGPEGGGGTSPTGGVLGADFLSGFALGKGLPS